jgi:hypothetical protein
MTKWASHKYGNELIGKRVADLEILSIIPLYRGKARYYKCEAKCHRCESNSTMTLEAVLNGKTGVCKECSRKVGRPKGENHRLFVDITGQRFGKLTAVRVDSENKNGDGTYWICKCDCGNEKSILGKKLRDGVSHTSCGCSKHQVGDNNRCWKGYKDISGKYWKQLEKNAIERDLLFILTIEEAWDIFVSQDNKCALTGIPLTLHNPKTASLDRIDSTKDYTKDNVQWVHIRVNKLKMDMPEKELYYWCEKIYKYKNEKST